LLRVGQRLLERALRDACRLRGDADASAIERRERDLIPFAFVSDAAADRHFASVNEKFTHAVAWMPSFFSSFPGFESGRAALDRQSRDSFFAFRRIGVYIDDRRVSHAAIGDPRLGAVDNVAVAFAHCLWLRAPMRSSPPAARSARSSQFFQPRANGARNFFFCSSVPKR